MSAMQRTKGATAERHVCQIARAHGFPDALRTSDGRHQRTRGDIAGIPAVSLEVKRVEALQLRKSWQQTVDQAGPDLPVLAHRWNHGQWLAVLPLEDLFDLLKLREL